MADSEIPPSKVHRRGAEPSLVERFGIEGLYGYRSISLESDYAATILIAKNGTGKTTLLGALDAFHAFIQSQIQQTLLPETLAELELNSPTRQRVRVRKQRGSTP